MDEIQAGEKYHKIYHTKKAKIEDEGETILPGKKLEQKKKRVISKPIKDLLLCCTHIFGIIPPKKVVEKKKIEKKFLSHIYDDFCAHLVETNLKMQVSNMHVKFMMCFPNILTKKTCRKLRVKFTSMRSVKDIGLTTS